MPNTGRWIFGLGAMTLGLVGLWWGDFATVWQPVPAQLPARTLLAYTAALTLLVGGLLLQRPQTRRVSAVALGTLYFLFALICASRILAHPRFLATWSAFAEQAVLVNGAVLAYVTAQGSTLHPSRRLLQVLRILFGLCAVTFASAHFKYLTETAAMVPAWMPAGQRLWAIVTGVAHLMAGLALISGIYAAKAARALSVMFLIFGVMVWLPKILVAHGAHMDWAGNCINLALTGAAWLLADALCPRKAPTA